MNNPVAWFELPTSDLSRATQFYNHVFGYDLEIMDLGAIQMAVFPHDGKEHGTGGALVYNKEFYLPEKMRGPLLYFHCDNIPETLQRAKEKGGETILKERQISEEYGYMAVLLDSEGNRIALHSDKKGIFVQ